MTSPRAYVTDDAAGYLERAGDYLRSHPVEHSVLLTTAHRRAGEPSGDALWLWVERDGQVVAAAQHTPPMRAYVSMLPDDTVPALVVVLHEQRPELPGVGGMRAPAEAFAERWCEVTGVGVSNTLAQGVYVADTVHHPAGVAGHLRAADLADLDLVQAWADTFQAELDSRSVPHLDMRPRIAAGQISLWEDAGRPVSVAMVSPAYGGVSRVSLVYTPPEHRRRGYAAACVAAVTQRELDRGDRCMLYTDAANPTSNGVYQRIGYRRVQEAVDLSFG